MMVEKYPKRLENLRVFEGECVLRLISSANTKPRMVTARAVSSRFKGMVIRGTVVGDNEPGKDISNE